MMYIMSQSLPNHLRVDTLLSSAPTLITLFEIDLKEDNKEAVDGRDNEDVPMELFPLIVTRVDDRDLSIGYKSVRDAIVYDEHGMRQRNYSLLMLSRRAS